MLKKVVVAVAVIAMASAVAWANCGSCQGDEAADKKCEEYCKAGDTVYACAACCTVDKKAGKCVKCGEEMKAMHVVAIKDGKASLCSCEAGCKCTVKTDDPKKCSCDKDIITLDCPLAGKKAECAQPAKPADESAKPKDHPAH